MGKLILPSSGGSYSFSFHAPGGDKIASSPTFIPPSSVQQALHETRMASERTPLYKKMEIDSQYYFELYNEIDRLLIVSDKYWSPESRDCALTLLKCAGRDAKYIDAIL